MDCKFTLNISNSPWAHIQDQGLFLKECLCLDFAGGGGGVFSGGLIFGILQYVHAIS